MLRGCLLYDYQVFTLAVSLPARERGGLGLNLYGKGTLLKVLKIVILLISGLNGFLQCQVGIRGPA
jgi:hypothetical protein